MECNLLLQDIGSCTDKVFKMFDKTAYWTEYDNIDRDSIVEIGTKVSFQLNKGMFYKLYDGSKKPFDGDIFKCEESSKHGYKIYTQLFNFPLRAMSQFNDEFVTALSKNKKVVVILPQIESGVDNESKYIVLGLSGGLKLTNPISEASGEAAWEITLEDRNTDLPLQFLGSATKTVDEVFYDATGYEVLNLFVNRFSNPAIHVDSGKYILNVDSGLKCKIITPTGVVVGGTTNAISTLATEDGVHRYYIPLSSELVSMEGCTLFEGDININSTHSSINLSYCTSLANILVSRISITLNNNSSIDASSNILSGFTFNSASSIELSQSTPNPVNTTGQIFSSAISSGITDGLIYMAGWDYSEWDLTSQALYTQLKEIGWTIDGVENTPVVTYTLGQQVEGGVVAYILQSGDNGYEANKQKGIIASLADISGNFVWGGSGLSIGTTSTLLMEGRNNTVEIHNSLGAGSYAANECYLYSIGGYSDWALPSPDEFTTLCQYNILNSNALGLSGNEYWTSFESPGDGTQARKSTALAEITSVLKTSSYKVRPIRYFSINL